VEATRRTEGSNPPLEHAEQSQPLLVHNMCII